MKEIKFMTFEKFKKLREQQKQLNIGDVGIYSRTYGNNDWGWQIKALYDFDFKKNGDKKNYIQVLFMTYDLSFNSVTGQVIPNADKKIMTLEGITLKNYKDACKWVERQREVLFDSVSNLKGINDPMLELWVRTELVDQKEIMSD